ncbi:MAG: IS21-like element helper ATPase IstB [Clostridia bacterium]|nr:IS21-like element helper ATPase IstB [Clostridia bacterium]
MTSFNALQNNLQELSLFKMNEILPSVIDKSVKKGTSLQDSLIELTSAEIAFRDERARKINIVTSHFPYVKTIKDFDFSYQPSINREQIMDFMGLRFIENKSNIIFLGSSGVGKTHLATAIGIEAASQRISTYFINFAVLMEKFKQAAKENRVEKIVKHYLKYTVLIIDEIGYLPVDKDAAYGFFQLIAARYEFRPTIITTNQSFSKWPDVFGDAVIANAIIDRLVHHCDIVKITGHSYRLKGRNIFEDSDE